MALEKLDNYGKVAEVLRSNETKMKQFGQHETDLECVIKRQPKTSRNKMLFF